MDIIEAVESIRSYKKEVVESLDMASALHEIATIRDRKQRAWNKHDALLDKVASSHTVSGVYNSTGVQAGKRHTAMAEMIEEASDLTKAIRKDSTLLYDCIALVEDVIKAIPDHDTRVIIEGKYLKGWTDTELSEMFSYHKPGYTQMLEQKYFQSLR